MDEISNIKSPPPKLPAYERTTACLLIIAMGFMIALNFYLDEGSLPETSKEPHHLVNPFVEVTVKGAVAKPGVYQVKKGTLVSEVIEMAEPLEGAAFGKMRLDSKITRRRTITVRTRGDRK